jgi:geranylgeranyl diphosphate synthase, type II
LIVDLEQYLKNSKAAVERALGDSLPDKGSSRVADAMRYSVEAGGKRLRPLLCLATAHVLGADQKEVIDVASALELIHTYSLIHDDLPAMDNSNLRRGKPSCHAAHGEAIAILAGDGLLTLAFEKIASYGQEEQRATRAIRIARELAAAAGVKGMIGGQDLDLLAEGKSLTLNEVEEIASLKTGALFSAAVRCGALAAGAGQAELEILSSFARLTGKAFQIVDDLLDSKATAAELGKPVEADLEKAKATLPALLGAEAAQARADELYRQATAELQKLAVDAILLQMLGHRLIYRNK